MPKIHCPHCGVSLTVPDKLAKPITKAKCPKCGESVNVAEQLAELSDEPVPPAKPKSPKSVAGSSSRPAPTAKPASAPPRKSKPPVDDLETLDDLDEVEDGFEEVDDDFDHVPKSRVRLPAPSKSANRASGKPGQPNAGNGSHSTLIMGGIIGGCVLLAGVAIGIGLMFSGGAKPNLGGQNPPAVVGNSPPTIDPSAPVPPGGPSQTATPATPTTAPAANSVASTPPAVGAPLPVVAQTPIMPLTRYAWRDGDQYVYKFELTSEVNGTTNKEVGTCDFKVQKRGLSPATGGDDPKEGSGSGFVVTTDGHIATCAHVVFGSTEIVVQLGGQGQKYPATIVKIDEDRDLAVIKINQPNTTPVPLGDSEHTPQAAEVYALGYPLSPTLGSSLKVNRGIVAGQAIIGKYSQLQIDAPINPGNSGGPVVNTRGELVGVASSKIASRNVSSVGFAVPSKSLKEFLVMAGVKLPTISPRGEMAGPQLITTLSPSIAFISVKIGHSTAPETELQCTVFSTPVRQPGLHPSFFNITTDSVTMRVNELGEVTSYDGRGEQLPFCLGPHGALSYVPLPRGEKSEWSQESATNVMEVEQQQGPPLPSFMRRRSLQQQGKVLPAYEQYSYQFKEARGEDLIIKRQYELATTDSEDRPYLRCRGAGDVVFDKKRGVVSRIDFKGQYEANRKSVSVRIPLTITMSLLTDQELAEMRARQGDAQAKAEEKAQQDALPPTSAERAQMLAKLRIKDGSDIDATLNVLAKKKPAKPDKEMALAIAQHLTATRGFRAAFAVQALKNWGTPDVTPMLLEALRGDNSTLNAFLPDTFGAMQDPDSFGPLVEALNSSDKRYTVKNALTKIGIAAEDAIIAGLNSKVSEVVEALVDILGDVGGAKALAALEKLQKTGPKSLNYKIGFAITKIKKRI